MAVGVANVLKKVVRALRVEMAVQADCALPPHVETAHQQHARHAKRTEAFHLAESHWESIRRRF